jgi:hypothetical protein
LHHQNRCQVWRHGYTFLTCQFITYIDIYENNWNGEVQKQKAAILCVPGFTYMLSFSMNVGASQVLLKTVELLLEVCLKLQGLKLPWQLF